MTNNRKSTPPAILSPLRFCLLLAVVYTTLLFVLPANKIAMQAYHLAPTQYHILLFVVVLPLILIWFAAFYSYAKLDQYAQLISKTPEGGDFVELARGVRWLAWGLAIPSLLSIILNSIANSRPGFLSTALITTNYFSLLIPLIGFSIIRKGAQGLTEHAKLRLNSGSAQTIMIVFVVLGVAFCFFIFRQLNLHSFSSSNNPYFLPVWLLISTIIVPYLYAWFSGLLAAHDLALYSKHVSGVFYRQAMRLLAGGTVAVIASSVAIQCLRSVIPRSGHLSLSATLVIINIIYVIMAAGFIMLSIGANKLKKIEEI
ncbi:MAG: hypothetical protein JWL89_82 [Candidatus Saccharibacteria bacterium]|nr:hypothetical protein [Candidatus Saccharibacteria bacterium]